jgi:hypothetical protein
MIHPTRTRFRLASALVLASALLLSGVHGASAKNGGDDGGGGGGGGGGGNQEALKLRVNDAVGRPGGPVAIVLRTYAARPIRQGQISVRVRRRPTAQTLGLDLQALTQPVRPLTFVSAVVYSTRRDSTTQASPTSAVDSQAVNVQFASPSATVNAADGPLAVLRFRLDPAVTPGDQYTIEIDPAITSLIDAGGRPISLQPISAVLTVRAASDPLSVEAEGDKIAPGATAALGVQTLEPFGVSSGRVTLRYRASVASGPPAVRLDPRYGNATFTVDRSKPGVLIVDFQSPDHTFNTVPGTIVAVDLPTRASVALGTRSAVMIDPAGTWLKSVKGRTLNLRFESGSLVFE